MSDETPGMPPPSWHGTPPSTFVAHWGFSVPHIALLAVSVLIAYAALFGRER